MNPILRVLLIAAGVLLFAVGAGCAFGWWSLGPALGFGLIGFACWLASTLP